MLLLRAGKKQKGQEEKEVEFVLHNTAKSVNTDIEAFSFNTAIARLMELTNAMYRYLDGPTDVAIMPGSLQDAAAAHGTLCTAFLRGALGKNGRRIRHFQPALPCLG